MSFTRKLDKLETAQEARIRAARTAAIQTISDWIIDNTTKVEQDAWERVLLDSPISDLELASVGQTRSEAEAILAEVGQPTTDDMALAEAMLSCMPSDIIKSMNDAFTTRLPGDPAADDYVF